VLSCLRDGNARWVANTPDNPAADPARRAALAQNGQHPFVTVVTCADSRLPVERLFDRGVGEVFVVRVAGNVAGDSETGTVEYGVGHLHTPVVVVMGHTKCGAVAAAAGGAQVHGKIAGLVTRIAPAVDRARRLNPAATPDELAAAAVRENVWQTVFDLLRQSPALRESMEQGEVKVVGAVCDIATGRVDFLGEHPWQAELLAAMTADPARPAHAAAHDDK
jgi:carbonic anhydrase